MSDRNRNRLLPLTSDGKGLYMGKLRMGKLKVGSLKMGSLFCRKPLYPRKGEK